MQPGSNSRGIEDGCLSVLCTRSTEERINYQLDQSTQITNTKCLTAQKHLEAENNEQNWVVIHFIAGPDSL